MTDFKPNKITLNFIKVYLDLKNKRAFRSDAEFARALMYSPQTINDIVKGRRDVNVDILSKLFDVYKVRPSVLFEVHEMDNVEPNSKGEATQEENLVYFYLNEMQPLLERLNKLHEALETLKFKNYKNFLPVEWIIANDSYKEFEEKLILTFKGSREISRAELTKQLNKYYEVFNQEFIMLSYLLAELVINPAFKVKKSLKSNVLPEPIAEGRKIQVGARSSRKKHT